jgi:hypothetical protein
MLDGAIKPFWLEQMSAAVKRQHLENRLPAMLRASWQLQASLLKLNTEAARLGPGISGYDQWLFRDYWTQSSGIESIAGTTRALTADAMRQFNADAVILWDHDRVNFRCGEEIPITLVLSDFRPREMPAIRQITAKLGDETIELTAPSDAATRGPIGPWTGKLHAPTVTAPVKLKLAADAEGVHNDWPIWIWPAPPDGANDVIIARRLTTALLKRLESGAKLLLCDDQLTFPTQTASFKPAWWRGDEKGDFVHGNLFLDHPALAGFPHDGYGDLQTYELLNNRAVVNLDEVPGNIEPIVWAIDVPWKLRRMAYLWEARVGRGKMLVTSFDLSESARARDPATAWMYANLLRYAASDRFNPAAELPVEWLRTHAER